MARLRLGLLAGEASGDRLAAGMMAALKEQAEGAGHSLEFVGVGGELMTAQGLRGLASIDELAVNGFYEPVVQLPRLLALLRRLTHELARSDLDAFIGIDFNVFNFLLEKALRKRGVRTAHYVSPSVYAWRRGRTRQVARAADLLLCLFPFEPGFYAGTGLRAEYVGHPLADAIAPGQGDAEQGAARAALGLASDGLVVAILPGSRSGEVGLMGPVFLATAALFVQRFPACQFVIPCVRDKLLAPLEALVAQHPELDIKIVREDARRALTAADLALIKSGTSTLEAMLLGRPMVVSYRMGKLSYQLARRLIRSPYVALPNVLAGHALVPELLQYEGEAPALAAALEAQWQAWQQGQGGDLQTAFTELHTELRRGADTQAARCVLGLMHSRASA
ncbi:MAG: lipid-A-disaccharide synthase [Pseudomonadota bacterium]